MASRRSSPLNGMDLLTLRLLIAAHEEGNLARVAEREHIAISAVSRRIADFESRFGVTMLDRHDRGVTASPDGAPLLERIAHVIEQLERIARDMQDIGSGIRGHIRIRAHMTAALSGSLPQRLADFLQKHPQIDIEFDEATSLEIVHAVRVGSCDVGLMTGAEDSEGVELLPWMEDELVAVLPSDHALAAKQTILLADLVTEPFIGMQRDSALLNLYRARAATLGQTLRERVHATSFESVRAMVAAGLGVAILPAGACTQDDCSLAFRRLDETWARRPLMVCVRKRSAASAAARLLIEHLIGPSMPV